MSNQPATKLKTIVAILLTLTLTLFALTACGTKDSESKVPDTQSKQDAENETNQSEPSSTDADTTEETVKDGEWMPVYQAYLLKALNETFIDAELSDGFRFGFFYLNNDEIPELWYVDGIGAHGASYVILTYRNGEVAEVQSGANNLYYYEKKGVFSFSGSGGAAIHGITFYQMTENGCEELESFVCEETEKTVYTINDQEMTEEEYNERQNAYDTKYGKSTYVANDAGFVFNEESIKEHCQ